MKLTDVNYEELIDARSAAIGVKKIVDSEDTLDLQKDKKACFDDYLDVDFRDAKDYTVEFDNFIFNSLVTNASSVDFVYTGTLPFNQY